MNRIRTLLASLSLLFVLAGSSRAEEQVRLVNRPQMHYVAIRTQAPVSKLGEVIPTLHSEVRKWMGEHGLKASDAPFIRYLVINMPNELDIELGWPVARPVKQTGRIHGGSLPAGKYVSMLYTGPYDGLVQANADLQAWASQNKITLEGHATPKGTAFASRLEVYITDPANEKDPKKWKTEVLYLSASSKPAHGK